MNYGQIIFETSELMFDIFIKEPSDLNDETISQTYHRPVFGPGKTQ